MNLHYFCWINLSPMLKIRKGCLATFDDSVPNRVSDSITIIGSSIIDYFWKNIRIFRLFRLFWIFAETRHFFGKKGLSRNFYGISISTKNIQCFLLRKENLFQGISWLDVRAKVTPLLWAWGFKFSIPRQLIKNK